MIDFLQANSSLIQTIWWITIGSMILLYLATNLVPANIIGRLLPLHTVFEPRKNLDLDFQSIGYAMLHKSWFSRITHYTIFIDAFFWFMVFQYWHWSIPLVILGLMILQSALIGEKKFTISFIIAGSAVYGVSLYLGGLLGWQNAYLVSITGLMAGGLIRAIGHWPDPIPPMVLDQSDKFVRLTPKTVNWKIGVLVYVGYIAEFGSGLPNRLLPVQVNYLYQLFTRIKPEKTLAWREIEDQASAAFEHGYSALAELREYYETVNTPRRANTDRPAH